MKFLLIEKSESKNPGPRYWLRIWLGNVLKLPAEVNAPELKHTLNPFEQLTLSQTNHLCGNQVAVVVADGEFPVERVENSQRQSGADEEVLRQCPAADGAVDVLVAELPGSVPNILSVKRVANIVVRIAVVVTQVERIELRQDAAVAIGLMPPLEISSRACAQV